MAGRLERQPLLKRRRCAPWIRRPPTVACGLVLLVALGAVSLLRRKEELDLSLPLLATATASAGPAQPPHIIMLFVDDLGFNDVGWSGDDFQGLTPVLSELREGGIDLETYYSQNMCTPSRAAFLTGRYPFRTGMQEGVVEPMEEWGLPLEYDLIPQVLAPLGYESYAIGKWHLGHAGEDQLPQRRGFKEYFGFLTGEVDYYDHKNPNTDELDFMVSTEGSDGYACVTGVEGKYSATLHTDHALKLVGDWKAKGESTPLFLYMAVQTPHYPMEPDLSIDYRPVQNILNGISDPARLDAAKMVYSMDLEIGRLLRGLQSASILDNSLILFASDNGGCYTYGVSNFPYRGTKEHLFEGGSRVRGFINSNLLPESKRGSKYSGMFHVVDWLPTILSAIGAPEAAPSDIDGVSHWDALTGAQAQEMGVRSEVPYNLVELSSPGDGNLLSSVSGALRMGDWKLVVNEKCQIWFDWGGRYDSDEFALQCGSNSFGGCGALTGDDSLESFLFNLADDPYETNNLFSSEPEQVELLLQRMGELLLKGRPSAYADSLSSHDKISDSWLQTGCIGPWLP